MDRDAVAMVIQAKSLAIAILLTLFFGGFGVFYVSVPGGIIMSIVTAITWLISFVTLGIAGIFLIPLVYGISLIWVIVGVNNHNKKLASTYSDRKEDSVDSSPPLPAEPQVSPRSQMPVQDPVLDPQVAAKQHVFRIRIAKEPGNVVLLGEYGDFLARAGTVDEALVQYFTIVELQPDDTDTRWKIAELYKLQNNIPKAVAQLHQILQIRPDDQKTQEELARLNATFDDVARKALSSDRTKRYDDTSEIARELEAAVDTKKKAVEQTFKVPVVEKEAISQTPPPIASLQEKRRSLAIPVGIGVIVLIIAAVGYKLIFQGKIPESLLTEQGKTSSAPPRGNIVEKGTIRPVDNPALAVERTKSQVLPTEKSDQLIIDRKDIVQIINGYNESYNNRNVDKLLSLYDEEVDYFNTGIVNKNKIRIDKEKYFKQWQHIDFKLVDEFEFFTLNDPDKIKVVFYVNFLVGNARKKIIGKAENTWVLKQNSGSFKIIDEKQKVINRGVN